MNELRRPLASSSVPVALHVQMSTLATDNRRPFVGFRRNCLIRSITALSAGKWP